jgi:hypothetical protein
MTFTFDRGITGNMSGFGKMKRALSLAEVEEYSSATPSDNIIWIVLM